MCVCVFFFVFLYKRICCGYALELHRQVDAVQMGTHNICLYKEVYKKYTVCNLKTKKLFDCVFIAVCSVFRSNTLFRSCTVGFIQPNFNGSNHG